MKRLLPGTGFLIVFAVLSSTGVWARADSPAWRAPLLGCAEFAAASPKQGTDPPATVAEQYRALDKEFSTTAYSYWQLTNDEERAQIVARVDKLPLKILELAQKNPKDPIALEALTHIVTMEYWLNTYTSHPGWGKESPQAKAIALMLRDHLESDQLAEACKRVHYCFRQECETFLRTVLEKSPHRDIRGLACLQLAQYLLDRVEKVDLLKDKPESARHYEAIYGKDYLEALQKQDRTKVIKEAESLYEQANEKYGDVKIPYAGTIRETAETELFEIRNLIVGKQAQEMEGMDQDGQQFKLSDYRGKVVLVYFWSEY
jgi:hypothetical protein